MHEAFTELTTTRTPELNEDGFDIGWDNEGLVLAVVYKLGRALWGDALGVFWAPDACLRAHAHVHCMHDTQGERMHNGHACCEMVCCMLALGWRGVSAAVLQRNGTYGTGSARAWRVHVGRRCLRRVRKMGRPVRKRADVSTEACVRLGKRISVGAALTRAC